MGQKRGTGRGGFIDSVVASIDGFYGEIVQHLRPWAAKAPQLPPAGKSAAESAGIDLEPPPSDLNDETDVGVTGSAVEGAALLAPGTRGSAAALVDGGYGLLMLPDQPDWWRGRVRIRRG